jgi:UDP-3-O-[3-hydroxymyristoyl] glucosamine N-acyltransferase
MKLKSEVSVQTLASLIHAEVIGNKSLHITGINEIHQVEYGDVVFVDHPKYYDTCLQSAATCIIINNKDVIIPEGKALLYCNDPFEAYCAIIAHFKPVVMNSKSISDSATIGNQTVIMPNVYVGNNVIIGDRCTIFPGVVILLSLVMMSSFKPIPLLGETPSIIIQRKTDLLGLKKCLVAVMLF